MNSSRPTRLIAIVGGSGAGKGWLVERLVRLFEGQASHLALDNFYRDRSHLAPARRDRLNFDSPRAIDWERAEAVLRDCQAGRTTSVPRYDFATHRRLPAAGTWQPTPVVLVEGLTLLVHARVRRLFDLKIYLDCPSGVRLRRRLRRDVAERGRTPDAVKSQFRRTVIPMHTRYIAPQQQWADVILAQPFRGTDIVQLAARLSAVLDDTSPLHSPPRLPLHRQLLSLLECHDHLS